MLEVKNAVVVVVLIFLKHNGMSRQTINNSELCSQSKLQENPGTSLIVVK